MRDKRHNTSAFAVLEVVVALVVITTALVGGVLLLHTMMAFADDQCRERAAREIAFSRIEILRSREAEPLENCSSVNMDVDLPSFKQLQDADCILDVSDREDMAGVKVVTVTARWKGVRRRREVKYTSLVGVREEK